MRMKIKLMDPYIHLEIINGSLILKRGLKIRVLLSKLSKIYLPKSPNSQFVIIKTQIIKFFNQKPPRSTIEIVSP